MSVPALWQFKCSHFSEKVRWTLDWKGVQHKRFSLYPGWHMPPTLAVSPLNLHPRESIAFFTGTSAGASFRLYKPLFDKVLIPVMLKAMRLHGAHVEESRARVIEILVRFEKEVQPSGYLVGDSFSVADLTLASLLSTLVVPAEYPYPLAVPFPENVLEYRASLERFSALSFTHEMYRKHRPASAEV